MQKTQKKYKIRKILNNSSIIVQDTFKEYVLIAKGIGFGYSANDWLPKGTAFDKIYKFSPGINQFSRITNGYDESIIEMVMDTIELILQHDKDSLKSTDVLSISDHLAAAYTRILNGEAIQSFFSYEIQALYPFAFEKTRNICETIERKYGIVFPIAEVCYIGLHIQNMSNPNNAQSVEHLNMIIVDVHQLLTKIYHYPIESNDMNYLRFITHLRFLVEGAFGQTRQRRSLHQDVSKTLQSSYPDLVPISQEVISIIEDTIKVQLSEEETTYILLHLVHMLDGLIPASS